MTKCYSQVLVLIGVCMAFGQGISEKTAGHSGKDTAVAISNTTVVSQGKIAKNDTAIIASAKDTSRTALRDTTSAVLKDSINTALKDTSVVVSGNQSKPDSVKETSNSIALDTTTSKVSESSITAVQAIPEKKEENKQVFGGRSGIGVNLLLKVFNSKEINNFLGDVYDKWIDEVPGVIVSESGFSSMNAMMGFNLKGIIYVSPVVGLEPFGSVGFAKKMFIVRNYDHEVDVRLVDISGGVNIWARVAPKKCVSFKAGLGGYVSRTTLKVDSYAGKVDFYGIGYGVNVLAGIDITLRKMAINIDFLLPVGMTELDQYGSFKNISSDQTIRYPKEYMHTGFVIRPGFTFQF